MQGGTSSVRRRMQVLGPKLCDHGGSSRPKPFLRCCVCSLEMEKPTCHVCVNSTVGDGYAFLSRFVVASHSMTYELRINKKYIYNYIYVCVLFFLDLLIYMFDHLSICSTAVRGPGKIAWTRELVEPWREIGGVRVDARRSLPTCGFARCQSAALRSSGARCWRLAGTWSSWPASTADQP